ncbi:Alpha/Beta hydrolase protein [Lophiotrema nucula]|uniref:Alpha/Beta hydrolase protein n=1 Tax=Lophiotrema nucula TaxID=690887 RepID=A0A6A5ZT23_9PLEO|nr:Alpha/Beta hydrolase protein [Lophiotrema nucula]
MSRLYSRSTSHGVVPSTREFFYAGGEYVNIRVGNSTAQYMINQIYVEKLIPPHPSQPHPIIFIAGAGQTGTNFLETPDGRPGWASYFLDQGYTIYLTDQPSRGRSPWHPGIGSMYIPCTATIENLFTATSSHDLWPQSKLHTQWPGTGKVGDPGFDALYASQVQLQADRLISEETNAKSYTALLDKIGKSYLLTHSQAGGYGWRVGDARPDLVKGIIALEPPGPPFENEPPFEGRERTWGITDLEVQYDPPAGPNATDLQLTTRQTKDDQHTECILQTYPAKRLKNLAKIPVLIITAEASFHAPYDYCTVDYMRQAGVSVEYADLGQEGINGNGHMMFMEKNSIEIAERLLRWLRVN